MPRLRKLAVCSLSAAVRAALAALVPASPSAQAQTAGRQYHLLVNSALTNTGGVAAQGHNFPLLLTEAPSNIDFINHHVWVNLNGIKVPVWEIQFGTSGECMNSVLGGAIYEDSCVSSDTNEWFWQVPTGSSTNGFRNFWYINAGSSAHSNPRTYIYMTAESFSPGALIIGAAPGEGGLAAWNRPCVLNC